METFDFISVEDFRTSLKADYRELNLCMKARAWKAVHVLAGSIIEALLIDYLIISYYKKKRSIDPLKMDLGQAITACRKEGILTEKTEQLSNAIKSYRNLIHPGRKIRLGEDIDENGARVAQALVDIVVKEISERRKETYGYTAYQIVAKLERDSSAVSILKHLLKSVNQFEVELLLLKVIPQRYIELRMSEFPVEHDTLTSLIKCFRSAFDIASDEIKRKVTKNFVSILKEESEEIVLTYETAFFRGIDLKWISSEEIQLVKEHLLSRLSEHVTVPLLQAVKGIGRFLSFDEVEDFVDLIIRTIIGGESGKLRRVARDCIKSEYWDLKEDVKNILMKRLDGWVTHFEQREQGLFADKIRDIRSSIDGLPF